MADKLSLNVKKSNFVIFRPYQKHIDCQVTIKIFVFSANSLVSLERNECVRYLVVLVDSNDLGSIISHIIVTEAGSGVVI